MQEKNAIRLPISIHNIKKLFLIARHWLTEILRCIDEIIDLIVPDKINSFKRARFITNSNDNSSTVCIGKTGNEWCKIRRFNLRRLAVKIFILLLMQNIVQRQHPIQCRIRRHSIPPFCKNVTLQI